MPLKLGLLFALIRPFKVLLLDEPTSALDAYSSALFLRRCPTCGGRLGGDALCSIGDVLLLNCDGVRR